MRKSSTPAQMKLDLRIHAVVFVSSMLLWAVGLLLHWLGVSVLLARRGTAD